jgi:pimeloyl-ACP methyl ester carboxylesterase
MAHFDGRRFRLHYVEQGKGPSIVFVHELGMDHTMFAAQFEDLPEHYRCLAFDMRGHGRSDDPPPPWTMQDVVVDLIAFIEGTNAAPCHLVGSSWGGMVALRAAIQREDLIRSLVLIATTPEEEDPEWVELYRGYEAAVVENDGVTEELARLTLPVFFGEPFMQREPGFIDVHVERITKMSGNAIAEGLRMVNNRGSMVDRLGEVRVPTLVIHGELDAALGLSRAEALTNGIQGAELVRVQDAGHVPAVEAPDVVNEALAGFFSRVNR